MNFILHLGSLLIAFLAVFDLVACGGGKDEEVPRQLIATAGFRAAAVPVFDAGRARFYTSLGTSVFAVDPANGAQIPLFDSVADAPAMEPVYPVPILRNVLSLSWSGNYLYIASSSGKLARFNFAIGQIDQRVGPPAGSPSNMRVVAVQASTTSDETVFALLQTTDYGAQAMIAKVESGTWAPNRLDLGVAAGGYLTMKPDGTEILYSAAQDSKKIRISSAGPESVDNLDVGLGPYTNPPAPRYVLPGVLWVNRILDSSTFATVFIVPGASACSPLANLDHLVCIGERNFIYDLGRRTVLSQWRREEVNNPFVGFGPTGWVSEAGPNRVAIEYQSATKGFSDRTASIYTDPSLN